MPENTGNQLNGSESPKRRQWPEGKGTWTLTQKSEALDWGGGGRPGVSAGGPEVGPPAPGRTGGGVEVLACIVPGREPCFLLPGTPRWRPGARSLSRKPVVWRAKRRREGRSSGPGRPVPGAAAQTAAGGSRVPTATVPGCAPLTPTSVGAKEATCPTTGWVGGGQAASASCAAAGGQQSREKQSPAPRPPRPRAAPARRAPIPYSPLARLRAFSGLWK